MFELRVSTDFAAAHHLVGYPGDCARVHGHNWVVDLFVRSRELDSLGMAADFRQLKLMLNEVISPWDHQDLNTLSDFSGINPTAERVSQFIFEGIANRLKPLNPNLWVDRVTVWENNRCTATYFGNSKK